MKTIKKSASIKSLSSANDMGMTWNDFVNERHDDYLEIREQALADQKMECAYSGLWLGEGTTQELHIDHFFKKSLYPELRFDWNNLFVAAKNLDYGSDSKDKSINGPRKISDRQYSEFLSPLEANLEQKFWYRQDGYIEVHPHVVEKERSKVLRSIQIYNLNAPELVQRRRGIIMTLRHLQDLDDTIIRQCMATQGFSFLVNFELIQRSLD